MNKIKLLNELSALIENRITEEDIFRINIDEVILYFIDQHDIDSKSFKTDEMLNELVDFIRINNDASRIELW